MADKQSDKPKRRNPYARNLRDPRFGMRVVRNLKKYARARQKADDIKTEKDDG
jgi:hypothetical protein